jgi:hypothetical protein
MSCGWPGGLSAESLGDVVPFGQIYIAAGEFTASPDDPGIWHPIQMNAQEQAVDAWECPYNQQSEMFCIKDFKGMYVDWSDPQFRVRPVWLQIDDENAPDPTQFVNWTSALLNTVVGGSYDQNNNTFEYSMLSPALAAWDKAGGKTGDNQASIGITSVNGDALSATGSNSLLIEIERHSGGAWPQDTFQNSAYLLGVGIQFKTNFSNYGQWPI